KRLKVATNEKIEAAVYSTLINIKHRVEEPFKAVNVKESCDNISGIWWEVREKTIRNCWKKANLCFMEDKQTDNEENSKNGYVSDAEECVLSLQKSLTQLEEKSAKCLAFTWRNISQRMMIFWFLQELLKKIFCPKSQTKWKMMMIQVHRNLY
ncbi:hypothetical protein AVEN_149119-1, partial [Araneus ventricosus]